MIFLVEIFPDVFYGFLQTFLSWLMRVELGKKINKTGQVTILSLSYLGHVLLKNLAVARHTGGQFQSVLKTNIFHQNISNLS